MATLKVFSFWVWRFRTSGLMLAGFGPEAASLLSAFAWLGCEFSSHRNTALLSVVSLKSGSEH